MNPAAFTAWPVTLAQEIDTTLPPASSNPGSTTTTPGVPGADGTTATTGQGTGGGAGTGGTASPFGGILPIMLLVLGVLFFFSMTGGRKEKKRRAQMLADLRKGAKVQTAGGVLGTIVEVRDDEVLVKVDENSNTRMRFAKSAITAVTKED